MLSYLRHVLSALECLYLLFLPAAAALQVEFLKGVAEREELSDVVQSLAAIAAEVLDCGSFR